MTFNNEGLDLTKIAKIDLDKLIYFIKTTKIGKMITKPENVYEFTIKQNKTFK